MKRVNTVHFFSWRQVAPSSKAECQALCTLAAAGVNTRAVLRGCNVSHVQPDNIA